MKIAIPCETQNGENRVAVVPADVIRLKQLGASILIEKDCGQAAHFSDKMYEDNGATVYSSREKLYREADIVLRVRSSNEQEIGWMQEGAVHVSHLDPFNDTEFVEAFAKAKISAFSMEMLPRITRAQKMDALSSQANLAGYVSVIIAAERLNKIFPMMMTPAGTITAARVFVIGAGVAGLQAIATARRLGARVEAFDTRPVVAEQVQSLGAKFVKIELGETGQTKDGYAKALTPEQIAIQQQQMARHCAQSDVVITTAKLFGRRSPVLVTMEMIEQMQPGSVVVDLAVESGGNVEGVGIDQELVVNGVRIVGLANLPASVATNASQMYSANLFNFVEQYWDKEAKLFTFIDEDEIQTSSLITHQGKIVNGKVIK